MVGVGQGLKESNHTKIGDFVLIYAISKAIQTL
jgi:hypothetical protein